MPTTLPTFPTADELDALPELGTEQSCTLRMTHRAARWFGTIRIWTARTGLADGEPFDRTVYVEAYAPDRAAWVDLGHYDGTCPPESLAGYSPADLGIGAPA